MMIDMCFLIMTLARLVGCRMFEACYVLEVAILWFNTRCVYCCFLG